MKWIFSFLALQIFSLAAQAQFGPFDPFTPKRGAVASGPTVVASDNFTRGDAANLGANWTTTGAVGTTDPLTIVGNQAVGQLGHFCGSAWTANGFNNDQFSRVTIATVTPTVRYLGAMARITGSGNTLDGYLVQTDGTTSSIYRWDDGVPTQLGTDQSISFSTSDVIGISCTGTTIALTKNGSTVYSQTDATYASGAAAIFAYSTAAASYWEGGNN